MKAWLLTGASALFICGAAMAQPASTAPASGSPAHPASGMALQRQVVDNLRQSGFTDIQIMPDSFLVQAKDKSGNPITMVINPDSVTEVLALGSAGADQVQGAAASHPAASGGSQSEFVSVAPGDRMMAKLVGTQVRNGDDQALGTIQDLAFDGQQLQAYVIKTPDGREVAVNPHKVQVIWDHSAHQWHATMNATQAQLESAPAYHPA